jgi:hypothetical protein
MIRYNVEDFSRNAYFFFLKQNLTNLKNDPGFATPGETLRWYEGYVHNSQRYGTSWELNFGPPTPFRWTVQGLTMVLN